MENNIISNSVVRYNLEDFELRGTGNVARRNCLWSTRHAGNPGGLQTGLEVPAVENIITDPGYVNRAAKDFRLLPGSPCINFPLIPATQPIAARKKLKRPVRLWAIRAVVQAGRPRAPAGSDTSREREERAEAGPAEGAPRRSVAAGGSDAPGRRHLRGERTPRQAQAWRRFGQARVWSGRRALRLRASVKGVGLSNMVVVKVGR